MKRSAIGYVLKEAGSVILIIGIFLVILMGVVEKDNLIVKDDSPYRGERIVVFVKEGKFYVKNGHILNETSENGIYKLSTGKYVLIANGQGQLVMQRKGISSFIIYGYILLTCGGILALVGAIAHRYLL